MIRFGTPHPGSSPEISSTYLVKGFSKSMLMWIQMHPSRRHNRFLSCNKDDDDSVVRACYQAIESSLFSGIT
ncbi:hypothetical protein LINPERPRIM_LOCUS8458 [Linum perenne]